MRKHDVIPIHDPEDDRRKAPAIAHLSQGMSESEDASPQIPDLNGLHTIESGNATKSARPFKINYRFLIVFTILVLSVCTGSHFLHEYQVRSMADTYLARAEKAEREGNDETAKKYYKSYLRLIPDDRESTVKYALLYYRTATNPRQKVRSVFILENLIRKNEDRDDIRKILVDAHLDFGRQYAPRYQDALRHIEYLLEKNPGQFELVENRAECRWKLGEPERAIADYRMVLKANPLRFELYDFIARIYRTTLDKSDDADRVMDEMVNTNPPSWETYFRRAKYHRRYVRLRKAALDARRAFHLNKVEPDVLLLAVEMLVSTRGLADYSNFIDLPTLQRSFTEIEEKYPDRVNLTLAIIRLDLILDRPDEAIARLNTAISLHPNDMKLKQLLCELKIGFAEFEEAEKLIEELSTLKAFDNSRMYFQAWIAFQKRRFSDSILILKSLRNNIQHHRSLVAKVLILLAECYDRLGWKLEQGQILDELLQSGDLSSFDLKRIAQLLVSLGRYDQAMTVFGRFEPDAFVVEQMAKTEIRKTLEQPPALRSWDRSNSLVIALARFPEKKESAIGLRVEILAAQKRYSEAQEFLKTELKNQPQDVLLTILLADLSIRQNRLPDARKILDSIQNAKEHVYSLLNSELFYGAAVDSQDSQDSSDRLLALEKKIDRHETEKTLNSADAYRLKVMLAQGFDRIGNLQACAIVWKSLSDRHPRKIDLMFNYLDVSRRLKDLKTVKTIVKALETSKDAKNPYWILAKAVEAILDAEINGNSSTLVEVESLLSSPELGAYRNTKQFALALAQIYDAQSKFDKAISAYETAIGLGEDRAEGFRRLIEMLYSQKKYRLAEFYLEKLKEIRPESITKRFGQLATDLYIQTRNNEKALENAKRLVASDPENYRNRLWLAQIHAAVGNEKEAEEIFIQTTRKAESKPEPWVGYIFYLVRHSRLDEAKAILKQAITKIQSPQKDIALAQCYEQIGDFKQAEKHYKILWETHGEDRDVQTTIADFYFRRGSFVEAEPLLDALIAADTKYAKIARRQKALLILARDGFRSFDRAISLVERNLKENPQSIPDELLKCRILSTHPAKSRRNIAIAILESIERMSSLSSENRYLLAKLYLSVGNWPKSRDLFQLVASTDRENPLYLATFVEQMLLQNENNESVSIVLKRLKSIEPKRSRTVYLEMLSLAVEDRVADAVEKLRRRWPKQSDDSKTPISSLKEKAGICEDLSHNLNTLGYAVQARHFSVMADGFYRELIAKDAESVLAYARFMKSKFDVFAALQLCERFVNDCNSEKLATVVIEIVRVNPEDRANLKLARQIISALRRKKPDSGVLTFQMANLEHIDKNYSKAIDLYRESLKRLPKSIVAMNELAVLLRFEGKNYEEALRHIDRAIRLAGPVANLLDTRAMIFYADKEYRKAETDLVLAIEFGPSATKYFHLALVRNALERKVDARIAWKKGMALGLQPSRLHPLERKIYPQIAKSMNE